jgi:hypothetical protein
VHSVCEDAVELSREFYMARTLELLRSDPSSLKLGRFDPLIKEVTAKLTQMMDEVRCAKENARVP